MAANALQEKEKKSKTPQKVFIGIFLTVLGLIGLTVVTLTKEKSADGMEAESEGRETIFSVTTTRVLPGSVVNYITLNGDVAASSSVAVYPDAAGKISSIRVRLGERVRRNQVIAEVDPSRPGLSYAINPVRAPVSGTITDLPFSVGDTINQQLAVATVGDLATLQVKTFIPERFISKISPNIVAELSLQSYPGEVFPARVVEVSPVVDPVSRTMELTLEPLEQDARIKAGMFVQVKLTIETREEVLRIPTDTIISRFGETFVYVVGPEEQAEASPASPEESGMVTDEGPEKTANPPSASFRRVKKRLVRPGIEIDGISEILQGLMEEEEIVYQGQSLLEDNVLVKVVRTVQPLE